MLVYGDSKRVEKVGAKRARVEAALEEAVRRPPGIERHAALVRSFIEAGEFVQGLADAEFERRGYDARSPAVDAGIALLVDLGRAIDRSWNGGFSAEPSVPTALPVVDDRQTICTRKAEGYAFYALYPETYLEAARRSGLGQRTGIIGIRSIGLSLAALVAAALGAPNPVSVRPVGHPFHREVRIGEELTADILESRFDAFAIVDEGPGLSGSSFGAVADWLEARGIARDRIHFFPSHSGPPGPHAGARLLDRWNRSARHVVDVDEILLGSGKEKRDLRFWVADLIGPVDNALEDVAGGAWRARRFRGKAAWPAANTQQERRKYIARTGEGSWLVKFAGLGAEGERKFRLARHLHRAGFGTEPVGLRYGFLVERWIEDAPSLDAASFGRDRLLEEIGAYLGFRARELPAESDGASLSDLGAMAVHNASAALGTDVAKQMADMLSAADALQARVRRVGTDNRMHAHEWLAAGDRLIKTDALDHNAGHDLVGCQDIAWDVAGAVSEFGLSPAETDALIARVEEASGHAVDKELLAFLLPCYLAFQLGACTMAVGTAAAEEARRLEAEAGRYRSRLAAILGGAGLGV